ncbi:MAG: M48 family metalloprotease [Proteobacteria bacterium]|nr:M48 family metalloprotease [Pseudomonadota bacterium]
MDEQRFTEMVERLEQESRAAPVAYKVKVALLAAVGFGVLLLVLLFAGLGIVLLIALVGFLAYTGKFVLLILKLGKFLILLAAPLWILLKSSVAALFTRFPKPVGREIRRAEAPALFAAIDRLRARMRGPAFHHVLVNDDVNAAVVQRPLLGLFGLPRNYLILGLPLLESVSADEALAVVAHEYGHLSGAHAHFGAYIYRLRHTWSALQDVASRWDGVGGRAVRTVIGWYAPFFNAYTFVLARAQEYEADAASAELVSPAVAANALKRINVAGAQYQRFFEQVFKGVGAAAEPPRDVSERWAHDAVAVPSAELATRWLADSLNRRKSPFDTHPVLRARLEALPGQASQVAVLPPPLSTESAATAWLGGLAAQLRSTFQDEWRAQVEAGWRRRHQEWQSQRARIEALRALPTPTLEETIERLQLQTRVEPDVDHLPEISAFNRRTPDRAVTLYLEGSLRLDRDDDTGLGYLRSAMALDAEAVKPACQRAYAFLKARGQDELAEEFSARWNEQHALDARREAELEHFDSGHTLVAAELDAEALAQLREQLARSADGIARVWIARRLLPSDAKARTFVFGVELTRWARFRSRGPEIVKRLATLEWPMHAFFVPLDTNKAIGERLRGLGVSPVFEAD